MAGENENLESNENQTIDTIPFAQTIAGAAILGIAENGDTNLFRIDDIKGDYKGLATASTNPGTPVLEQAYDARPGTTYPNFKDAGGAAITIPSYVGSKPVLTARLIFNGNSWAAEYTPTDVDVTPPDQSIGLDKLSFRPIVGQVGKNLVDNQSLIPLSFIDNTTGNLLPHESLNATPFIKVDPGTNYYKNGFFLGAYYNADLQYISGFGNGVFQLLTPENAEYIRFAVSSEEKPTIQLELGSVATSFEPYQVSAPSNIIKQNSIEVDKLSFKTQPFSQKNRFDISNIINGFYVDANTGQLSASADFSASNFIDISDSDKWHKTSAFQGAFFDENFDYISGVGNGYQVITKPAASKYFRYSILTADKNIEQFETGSNASSYEPFSKISLSDEYIRETTKPLTIVANLKELAPEFYLNHLKRRSDVVVVLLGDSISTTNKYTKPRLDAMYRPPLMVEHAYVTEIEQQLRWDGQKYFRYDTGIFSETATTKQTKEYDTAWDWVGGDLPSNNNRPALTRVLSGTDCELSFRIPDSNAKRCDFIFRTDYLNADSATLIIADGNGKMLVFDEATNSWVEANNYNYSAKEANIFQPGTSDLRKSMYQKRLKMMAVTTYGGFITIRNNGTGRLTYWGIQTGIREFMFDFILAARGGHWIDRAKKFEAWDIDYYAPDLILWEIPIINEGLDFGNSDYSPKNLGAVNDLVYSQNIITQALSFKNKTYSPELISWVMWFGVANYAIKPNNEWVYGYTNDGTKCSIASRLDMVIARLNESDINALNLFRLYLNYVKRRSADTGETIIDIMSGSGSEGKTITIDGVHFNTSGAEITSKMFGSFFIQ